MSTIKSFYEKSYERHSEHFREYLQNASKGEHARTWLQDDTVDAWRHKRMYRALDPILVAESSSTWLTVGDGRYGRDAKYIIEKGGNALPSDISEYLLREAKDIGYIQDYKVENAESLSFSDAMFDYVLCKESYHHFPRPTLALYEMLRVAKKGVILIEPNDIYFIDNCLRCIVVKIKNTVKYLFGKRLIKHSFEESGNYVYTISRREIEKVALGLNYNVVAFMGINDYYAYGVEYEKISDNGPLQQKIRRIIFIRDLLCKLGVANYGMLVSIIFKEEPSDKLVRYLREVGYEIVRLPSNPYICD